MSASDGSYPSVWLRPHREQRSTLTRGQIVAEALRLLDTEGSEALSMRKLAAALGVGTTSLYWHVANRDELIELVVNEIYAELDAPDPAEEPDWRAAMRRFADSARVAIVRHRWVATELGHLVAAYPGPNLSTATERMLAVLEAGGFPLMEAEQALNTVSSYVLGIAMGEAVWRTWLDRHGQTPQDWLDRAVRDTEQITAGHERLRATVANYADRDPQKATDDDFAYGLERVLDGLQSRLDGPIDQRR
jgi:AcrR family transcriptional regulator